MMANLKGFVGGGGSIHGVGTLGVEHSAGLAGKRLLTRSELLRRKKAKDAAMAVVVAAEAERKRREREAEERARAEAEARKASVVIDEKRIEEAAALGAEAVTAEAVENHPEEKDVVAVEKPKRKRRRSRKRKGVETSQEAVADGMLNLE